MRSWTLAAWTAHSACIVVLVFCTRVYAQGILPKAITEQRLEIYLQYLTLSQGQRSAIIQLHADYLKNWGERFETELSVSGTKWKATHVREDESQGPSMEQSMREIVQAQGRLRSMLQGANDEFFDEIELMLSDEQLPAMQRVRLANERATYRRSEKSYPRERSIDLVEMLEGMPLSDEERAQIDAFLLNFEPVFVQALKEAAEADQRAKIYEFALGDIARDPESTRDEAVRARYDELQEKREKVRRRPSRRLVEVIRKGLENVKSVISPQSAAELQDKYNHKAYPEVYPDPAFAGTFYDQALKLENLDAAVREALVAYQAEYVAAHEKASADLAARIFDKSENVYVGTSTDAQKRTASLFERIKQSALKREQLNLAQPPKIRALLTPEQNEQLKPWPYEKTQPPRPWARLAGLPDDTSQREREALRKAFEATRPAQPAPVPPR